MATITSVGTGNWSAGSTWDSDPAIPGIGDAVVIATGHVVTLDTDTAALLSLTNAGSGNLSVVMGASNYTITAATIALGADAGTLISMSGAAPTKTLTINASTSITSGTGAYCHPIARASTATLTVTTGTLAAGSTNAQGINNTGTGTINITGNISAGGGSSGCHGLSSNAPITLNITNGTITGGTGNLVHGVNLTAASTVTLTNVHLVDGSGGLAYYGNTPAWINTGNKYISKYAGAAGATLTKCAPEPTAANLKSGVECGDVIGTYDGGRFGATP